jgi:two-component system response regulator
MSFAPMILVEADPDHAAAARAAFAGTQLAERVLVVANAAVALERSRMLGCPAVFVVALGAARPGALATLAELQAADAHRRVPIVVLTGTDAVPLADLYAAGVNSIAVKPDDPDDLTTLFQMVGTYWLQLNRPPPCD